MRCASVGQLVGQFAGARLVGRQRDLQRAAARLPTTAAHGHASAPAGATAAGRRGRRRAVGRVRPAAYRQRRRLRRCPSSRPAGAAARCRRCASVRLLSSTRCRPSFLRAAGPLAAAALDAAHQRSIKLRPLRGRACAGARLGDAAGASRPPGPRPARSSRGVGSTWPRRAAAACALASCADVGSASACAGGSRSAARRPSCGRRRRAGADARSVHCRSHGRYGRSARPDARGSASSGRGADPRRLARQHGLLAARSRGRRAAVALAEQEALHHAAAQAVQHVHLAQRLDAFGDHAQAERAGQRDDGRHHRRALRRDARGRARSCGRSSAREIGSVVR